MKISSLPQPLLDKAARHRLPKDRQRVILSDLFVRKILSRELSLAQEELNITRNSFGKPYLENQSRHFNLSHSQELIVLATDDTPVGIDIECIRPLDDLTSLLGYFSKEEQQTFQGLNPDEQLDHFYDLWTLKESYVKALGQGLSCPFSSFTIMLSGAEARLANLANTPWHFQKYALADHYKCAVCASHRRFPESFTLVSPHELFD